MLLGSTRHSVPWLEGPSWPLTPSSPCGLASAGAPQPLQCLQLVKSPQVQSFPLFLWSCSLGSNFMHPRSVWDSVSTGPLERCGKPHRAVESGPLVSKAPAIHLGDATPVSMGSLRSPMTSCTQKMAPSHHRVDTAQSGGTQDSPPVSCVCRQDLSIRVSPPRGPGLSESRPLPSTAHPSPRQNDEGTRFQASKRDSIYLLGQLRRKLR